MSYEVKILADSVSPDGVRLTTLQTRYPRFIHSEMLRHRVFSHSVASSRAIPTEKQIERVKKDPFIPETFNKRVKGMGVGDEFTEEDAYEARRTWKNAAREAASYADYLNTLGLDKSRANRLLEPFLFVDDIITATEWDNFFALRNHPAAQPEFQILAKMMRGVMETHEPAKLDYGMWHLPLVTEKELAHICQRREELHPGRIEFLLNSWCLVSAGRCARVSFDTHEQFETLDKSIERAHRLIASGHFSPFEHVARPADPMTGESDHGFFGNFRGWVQFRKTIKNEDNFGKVIIDDAVA